MRRSDPLPHFLNELRTTYAGSFFLGFLFVLSTLLPTYHDGQDYPGYMTMLWAVLFGISGGRDALAFYLYSSLIINVVFVMVLSRKGSFPHTRFYFLGIYGLFFAISAYFYYSLYRQDPSPRLLSGHYVWIVCQLLAFVWVLSRRSPEKLPE